MTKKGYFLVFFAREPLFFRTGIFDSKKVVKGEIQG